MIPALMLATALAATPVVAVGNGLVAAPPEGLDPGKVSGAWVSVVGDCLEEGQPGVFAVVDRSKHGATAAALVGDVAAVRALDPAVVVVAVGAMELRAPLGPSGADDALDAFATTLGEGLGKLRADDGPAVLVMGLVGPTLDQLDWDEPVEPRQAAIDARIAAWNTAMAKVVAGQDGVWFVDLWSAWPRDGRSRRRLTRGGWGLTDPAHARVGAVICEEIQKKLKNPAP